MTLSTGQSTGRVLRQPTYKPGLAGVYDHELDALEAEIERLRDPRLVHLWTVCPDCGKEGAHHSYTDRAGNSVGVRCG